MHDADGSSLVSIVSAHSDWARGMIKLHELQKKERKEL